MQNLLRKKISNHPVLTDVERHAVVDSICPIASAERLTANVAIEHSRGGKVIEEMRKVVQLQTSNAEQRADRDVKTFAPVQKDGETQMIGGFDLFMKFMKAGAGVPALLDFFVGNADAEKEFD